MTEFSLIPCTAIAGGAISGQLPGHGVRMPLLPSFKSLTEPVPRWFSGFPPFLLNRNSLRQGEPDQECATAAVVAPASEVPVDIIGVGL